MDKAEMEKKLQEMVNEYGLTDTIFKCMWQASKKGFQLCFLMFVVIHGIIYIVRCL